ncbi:hypothetical protein SLEP1_g21056 [Rubroshorea leprosula]|uniref:Leucine-rich repeat-containing N-terminal plant-type domain-containing protein n=1 Tax=Rubroshorea leprosula TaxID=152421 RepID=A0AAV5JA22_9ROSI|nr:hypothetical protein SLEP1_g21056 [Rubroshorea leprosula]
MSKTKLYVLLGCFFLSSALVGARSSKTHPDEVSALQTIKKSLIDPNKNLTNWNRGDPCTSNSTGVVCSNTTPDDGYLHVTELLLSGNQLTGSLPDELGYLSNLEILQVDENNISGPIPTSFANLNKTIHFHMNNNSISGQIPPELSKLANLIHFFLNNNNLSGYLPEELAQMPNLTILQLDNNNFDGATIPRSFGNIPTLLKLSGFFSSSLILHIAGTQIWVFLLLSHPAHRCNPDLKPRSPFPSSTPSITQLLIMLSFPPLSSSLVPFSKLDVSPNPAPVTYDTLSSILQVPPLQPPAVILPGKNRDLVI